MAYEFNEERYVIDMFDRGVFGINPDKPIKLKSGRMSPHYHNQRPTLSINRRLDANGTMSVERQQDLVRNTAAGYALAFDGVRRPFHHVFGKAQAATAIMAVAAAQAGLSYLWERVPEDKDYGKKQPVEGDFEYGDFVHLADDNTTDGKSKIEGAAILFKVGLQPVSITVGFDREEGAQTTLESMGYEMNAVTGLSSAVAILRDNGKIGSREVEAVVAYHEGLVADGITSTFQLAA